MIILSGIPNLSGNTVAEKAGYFADNLDCISTAVFQEPRGLLRGVGALITPPTRREAQLGVFYMDSTSPLIPMCGHGSIGVITAAIEFGIGETVGACHHRGSGYPCGSGHRPRRGERWLRDIGFYQECSLLCTSAVLDVPETGRVPVDVLALIVAVRFFPVSAGAEMRIKNLAIFPQGDKGIDRSPCGTGTSAHLAPLYAKGQITLGQESIHERIIGTTFTAKAASQTKVHGLNAIIPEITGSGYTMGISAMVLSPNDPMIHGFHPIGRDLYKSIWGLLIVNRKGDLYGSTFKTF